MENVKFNTMHLKQLVDTNKFDDAKEYINKFFFTSGSNIFFFDGNTFILEDTKTAINRIPNDIKFKSNLNSFDARQYIKNAEFMANDYTPTIDFSKERFFVSKHTVNGKEVETKHVNMAKPFAIDVNFQQPCKYGIFFKTKGIWDPLSEHTYVKTLKLFKNDFAEIRVVQFF
jgi:hypothetical protein